MLKNPISLGAKIILFLLAILIVSIGFLFFGKSLFVKPPIVSAPASEVMPEPEKVSTSIIQDIKDTLSFNNNELPATTQYPTQKITLATPFNSTLEINEPLFNDHTCAINDYGAIAGGKISNTAAFEKAIGDCAKGGGGTVIVPDGIWLTGPINLQSNINLHLEKNAEILFSDKFDEYLPVVFSRFEGIEYYNYRPAIYAKDLTNVAITGEGIIDGQGPAWWGWESNESINKIYAMGDDNVPLKERVFGRVKDAIRPSFIQFINCNNVLVSDVTLKNGSMWTVHPIYSNNVVIRNIKVFTNPGPSTDGIAIDSSKNVLIENSTFNTGDDAIVLKSGRDKEGMRLHRPTESVVIRNNNILDAHGAIAIGSEVSGDIRNIFATDNTVDIAQYGFRIKSALGRGGTIENIWIEKLKTRRIKIDAIKIDGFYGSPFRQDSTAPTLISNINLKEISAIKSPHAITINGNDAKKITGILLENINIESGEGVEIKNANNIIFKNDSLAPKQGPMFSISESNNIEIAGVPCPAATRVCLNLSGENVKEINIAASGFANSKKIFFKEGAKKEALIRK